MMPVNTFGTAYALQKEPQKKTAPTKFFLLLRIGNMLFYLVDSSGDEMAASPATMSLRQ